MGSFDKTLIDENDEEFDVHVEYNAGYYTPAKLSGHPDSWAPAEGEDPEITSVKDVDGNELVEKLSDQQMDRLVKAAWEDQESGAYEPDCDDYPDDDWDDRAADEAADRYEKGLGL